MSARWILTGTAHFFPTLIQALDGMTLNWRPRLSARARLPERAASPLLVPGSFLLEFPAQLFVDLTGDGETVIDLECADRGLRGGPHESVDSAAVVSELAKGGLRLDNLLLRLFGLMGG